MDPLVTNVLLSIVGLVVVVTTTLGGFAYKVLDGKIGEAKKDAKQDVDDEERRRKEADVNVVRTVGDQYEHLRRDIGDIKTDIKDLRKEVND
jgi:hypothetical protein